jgi:hypothetical protein
LIAAALVPRTGCGDKVVMLSYVPPPPAPLQKDIEGTGSGFNLYNFDSDLL